MSLFMIVYGFALLIGVPVSAVIVIIRYQKRCHTYTSPVRATYERVVVCSTLLWLMYPLGNGFKFALFGPELLRFHLSDIGFPAFLVMAYSWVIREALATQCRAQTDSFSFFEQRFAAKLMRAQVIAFLVSCCYEAFTGYIHHIAQKSPQKIAMVGSFDWWDILSYAIGSCISFALLWWRRSTMVEINRQEVEYERQLREKRASRPRTPRSKKPYTSTRRRGGRK